MAINLRGRIPVITNPLSSKLIWIAAGIFVFALIATLWGFRKRVETKAAMTEHRQNQTVASDAATSNRLQVEGGQSGSYTAPSLPIVSSTAPTPGTTPAAPLSFPTGVNGSTVAPLPGAYPPAPNSPFPTAPAYAPYPSTPVSYTPTTEETREQLREKLASRRQERERQAIEGPTGIQEQRAAAVMPPLDPAEAQLAKLDSLLRQGAPSGVAGASPYPAAYSSPGSASLFSDSAEGGQGYRTQNGQSEKRKFAEGEPLGDDYLKAVRTLPLSQWVVQRGTVIPASLPHQVVSDLPGDLIAEVVRDVYDSPTQKYVEIPAGSRLVGEYNSNVSYGQGRVQIVWTAIYFPDGTFIDLARFPSHSADGSTGLKDKTDNHYKRLIAGVALTSLLSAGLQLSQNRTNGSVLSYPSTGQVIASGIGTQASQLGEQLTQRNMNIQPTLRIRPGEIFSVSVTKDIVFQGPYQAMAVGK